MVLQNHTNLIRIESTYSLPRSLWLQWRCGLLQHVLESSFFPFHLPGLLLLSLPLSGFSFLKQLIRKRGFQVSSSYNEIKQTAMVQRTHLSSQVKSFRLDRAQSKRWGTPRKGHHIHTYSQFRPAYILKQAGQGLCLCILIKMSLIWACLS